MTGLEAAGRPHGTAGHPVVKSDVDGGDEPAPVTGN